MFGVFFVAAAFGAAVNDVQRTHWGHLFNISYLVGSVWVALFEGANKTTNGAVFFRVAAGRGVAAVVLLGGAGGCCAGLPLHAGAQDPGHGGGAMSERRPVITFDDVSRFYGEVLGVNA